MNTSASTEKTDFKGSSYEIMCGLVAGPGAGREVRKTKAVQTVAATAIELGDQIGLGAVSEEIAKEIDKLQEISQALATIEGNEAHEQKNPVNTYKKEYEALLKEIKKGEESFNLSSKKVIDEIIPAPDKKAFEQNFPNITVPVTAGVPERIRKTHDLLNRIHKERIIILERYARLFSVTSPDTIKTKALKSPETYGTTLQTTPLMGGVAKEAAAKSRALAEKKSATTPPTERELPEKHEPGK